VTLSKLTKDQENVVKSENDAILVLASAGSGKTHVLTERVRFLLEREKRTHVLALTFTNKAAEEMKVRLTESIKNVQNRAFIGTIHSFCLDMIRNRGHLIGYSKMPHIFEREADRKELINQVIEDSEKLQAWFRQQEKKHQDKFIYDALFQIGLRKKYLTGTFGITISPTTDNEARDSKIWDDIYQEYNGLLESQNAIDFDGIIVLAHRILVDHPNIADLYRRQYCYVLVDEAQDLNFAQYEMIKALCGSEHKQVMMVGDPNQAIYGFNGSNKKYMAESFPKDFGAVTMRLDENFRSSKAILRAANRLIHDSDGIRVNTPLEGEFDIFVSSDQDDEAKWIAEKISYLIDNGHPDILGHVSYDRIAVLARTKYVFPKLENILNQRNIPFFVKKTSDSTEFESSFVKQFDLGLRLLVNPSDQLHLVQLIESLDIPENCLSNILSLPTFRERFDFIEKQISNGIEKESFCELRKSLLQINTDVDLFPDVLNELKGFWGPEKQKEPDVAIIYDLEELMSIWDSYSKQIPKGSRDLVHFRSQVALGMTQTNKHQSGVTLGTIHSVKGLGFDIVFIMGMNEGTFPDYRSINNSKALDEEKNNAYVALTRAKRLLFITYPLRKMMPWGETQNQVPSRFIEDIQKDSELNQYVGNQ
jgi:DNA helicase-2/ATP-dependent DNA helicase PcrA